MNAGTILFSVLAVLAGMLFPTQTAVNAKLAAAVGGPLLATLISFAAGLAALATILVITTRHYPDWSGLARMPPWLWVAGGFLGATYLSLNVFLVPKIGVGAMMCFAIAGQMVAALTLDTAGLFGLMARELTIGRVAGATMVAVGAMMVRFL